MRMLVAMCCLMLLAAGPVEPKERWDGRVSNLQILELAPESGFIADEAALERIWKEWNPAEKQPEVDFKKDLLIVVTAMGPNNLFAKMTLDDKGDLKVVPGSTKKAGPGFSFAMLKIPRAGVKSVNGKPVPA